jgi:hypothetical protein
MATEVTGPAGPTSRRNPVRAWSSRPSSLRGLRRPLSRVRRVDHMGVGGTVPRDRRWPCRTASNSGGDGLTGVVGGTVPGRDSPGTSWHGFIFDLCACACQCIQCPCRGSRYGGSRPVRSLEGVFSSRSRRDLARGGVQPPSEAESRLRGRPAPERGRASLEGVTSPRSRRSFTSAAPCPSSEAEFRPRVARPTVWWAVGLSYACF